MVSILFYAWGEPKFVLIMLISIVFNYLMALLINGYRQRRFICKFILIVSIAGNVGLLVVFKYLFFIISNINHVLGIAMPLTNFALPIGISFFTFQALSYVIDVYRGDITVQKKLQHIGLYISFFPMLIAGPIVRYKTIEKQIENRYIDFNLFSEGVHRFINGFLKKILLANNMALIADNAFSQTDAERSVMYAWLGAIAYSLQILFDFTGYSDMAIGLGKMFGFNVPENFNEPYTAKTVSEFWRRWHISLGQWFRDYVYFPLGGSRVQKKQRLIFNLFVVWLLTGIWHGASWNFIWWGLLSFFLISLEKLSKLPEKIKNKFAITAYRMFTLLSILVGWVLFRSSNIKAATGFCLTMLGMKENAIFCENVILTLREYWPFVIAALFFSTNISKKLRTYRDTKMSNNLKWMANTLSLCVYLMCFIWAVSFTILGAHNPFIYFNF